MKFLRIVFLLGLVTLFSSCGFHLQGDMPLAPSLHRLYLQSNDPYSYLTRQLSDYLKMSHVQLVSTPAEADTILVILKDDISQSLLSVGVTQQTRQYSLTLLVIFEITDKAGHVLVPPQAVSESKTITVQSNQILGSSNEATLFYQQMRRAIVYTIMNRISSREVTRLIEKTPNPTPSSTHEN